MSMENIGVEKTNKVSMKYEALLFDTSRVHTIDIQMDNWDNFISSCTDENYTACNVVIDGEKFENVAIRAKGNTSLSQVSQYNNNRYSFKIEFDHYDDAINYYGLDKLCLNNIIQDNTYMKDYLVYQMMRSFSVATPLCSYIYVTVNGEDFGLYLAVEGVEESFLQRNNGTDYGELYKPDSTDMGGGRGNGEGFNIKDFDEIVKKNEETETTSTEEKTDDLTPRFPKPNTENNSSQPHDTADEPNQDRNSPPNLSGEMPQIPEGMPSDNMPYENGNQVQADGNMTPPDMGDNMPTPNNPQNIPNLENSDFQKENMPTMDKGNFGGMGSDDVSLIYTDDNYSSYSNIFDNAKTNITSQDKKRLISSLRKLNENEEIETVVNVEQVIRYFVVHNFVLNFDSYTGSMIHNYYLYEKDGKMSMIPWDYNLAFGGFMSVSDTESLINYPINSPVSGGTVESRPMLSWIFNNQEYTDMYHEYFSDFINSYFNSGEFAIEIQQVKNMISPYVEKDPTKFCTYEEFETGIDTLKEFCILRAESVEKQLNGEIGATTETQDKTSFVSANNINISDMGSMESTMGKGMSFDFSNPNNDSVSQDEQKSESTEKADEQNSQSISERKEEHRDIKTDFSKENGKFGNSSSFIFMFFWILLLLMGFVFVIEYQRRKRR